MRKRARRGVTAVLAMLYLTLMASLALGFYSASNTAVMVTYNEQKVEQARLAAESGLEFARYHISRISIPAKTAKEKRFEVFCTKMAENINGSGNINKGSIYVAPGIVRVPAKVDQFIKSDSQGSDFQILIEELSPTRIRVSTIGRHGHTISTASSRAVKMEFDLEQNNSKVFQYGIATRGTVVTSGSSKLMGQPDPSKGSILSLSPSGTPVSVGGKLVTGDISITNPNGSVPTSGSVGGSTNTNDIQTNHVHKGVDEPEFPTVDTSMYRPYATNVYTPGKSSYSNIIIPPNTNPSFNAGVQIKGVMYVKTPNKITFNGHASIQGAIVTDTEGQVGNLSTNQLNFSGGFDAKGVETLDPSYGDLRKLGGSFILMPGFALNFTGNFGATAEGIIVADKASMTGSSSLKLQGSMILMSDTPMTMGGSSELTAGDNAFGFPTGLKFSNRYRADPSSYEEIKPSSLSE